MPRSVEAIDRIHTIPEQRKRLISKAIDAVGYIGKTDKLLFSLITGLGIRKRNPFFEETENRLLNRGLK